MALTDAEELELAEAALRRVLITQEYYVGPRRQRNVEYNHLTKRIDELRQRIADQSYGSAMATLAVQVGADQ